MFRGLFLLVALLAAACAAVGAETEDPVEVTLSRSVCFGFCPDYTVTITGDGEVRYSGRHFVNVMGEARASISRDDVQALLARFDAIGFERLRDEYRAQVTDSPTYVVTLTRHGRTKRLVDYVGVAVGMPESVRALEDEIDRVAGASRWVLRDGQPVRDTPRS